MTLNLESSEQRAAPVQTGKTLLIVDDEKNLCLQLARAMERRGFTVTTAEGLAAARDCAFVDPPQYAIVDLRLEDGTGLEVVEMLRQARPDVRVIMLTGYGNIATAVAAVKAGAIDYLAKPADADQITAALLADGDESPPPPVRPMTPDRVRWEHIQRVYQQCDRNVSETARQLNMHRRTLQRILAKHAPHE
ncbi:MAG: ActR/PrrA/RegA family redox response regulator transcription factor [Alphaproteobacteria bacterium]|nr:ActR/PrrA/RegA family redox response regulator transcription factor [Alphaproteobacteria bacterium]